MDLSGAIWRKSSRSSTNGGDCIEVAAWRKSRVSGTNGGDCVEVAPLGGVVAVRDSKDPDGPKLAISRDAWRAFTARIRDDA